MQKQSTTPNGAAKIRRRADDIVSAHVSMLPDQVVCALAAVITVMLWLRGSAQRCVWPVAHFRVGKDSDSTIQTDIEGVAGRPDVGAFVTHGGVAGAMAAIVKPVMLWIAQLAGSGSNYAAQRKFYGCATMPQPHRQGWRQEHKRTCGFGKTASCHC